MSAHLTQPWYLVPNDLIGGHCISIHNKPASQHNTPNGEHWVAEVFTEEIGQHIVDLHNAALR